MCCCEDLGEGADGLVWVGDAVVEDDDGAGDEILFGRRMRALRGMTEKAEVMVGFVPLGLVRFQGCHGPSVPRPGAQKAVRKKKPGRCGRDDRIRSVVLSPALTHWANL